MPRHNLTPTALLIAVLFCAGVTGVRAQQSDATKFNQTYETAAAKAQADCAALWADHAFDPYRDRIPFGEDKPNFAMLTNSARLRPTDKPIADLAIKTLERCRAAWAPAFAMLPQEVNAMEQGLQLKQDALIAELYSGKITFGDYNVGMDKSNGELARALSGIPQSPEVSSSPSPAKKSEVSEARDAPRLPPTESNTIPAKTVSSETRIALVIGDSNYANLPKLGNPVNDARAIAELLRKMGFTATLVTDASDTDLRREVRKFARESAKADIALVYYAGHAAQVGGKNYVLPVDMNIPQTEADIEFTGLNVEDLVNSMRARTKVVFLDACRDNPALFQNLVTGRGRPPQGLAAVGSSFQENPGGGVFIAFATEAGSVALDGQGEHSPFTQALLRNLDKPISIDDMFSLVTREVRLVTKNTQRPYKYASLENIVCLTGSCATAPSLADTDIAQEAERSETEDLQIALRTNNSDALDTYLQKYPESAKRNEILSAIAIRKRSEFDEWTLFEVTPPSFPAYLKLNSIRQVGDRVAVRTKMFIDPNTPAGHQYPDAVYSDDENVIDCKKQIFAASEVTIVGKTGQVLYHYKWADPEFMDLSMGIAVKPGIIAFTLQNIVCYEQSQLPLVTKKDLAGMNFTSVSSTVAGDGDIFMVPTQGGAETTNQRDIVLVLKMHEDKKFVFPGISLADTPTYRTEVDRIFLRCDQNSSSVVHGEFYDDSNHMVYTSSRDYSKELAWQTFPDQSPFTVLQRMTCKPQQAQQ